jgi:hypothetical protein
LKLLEFTPWQIITTILDIEMIGCDNPRDLGGGQQSQAIFSKGE